jgi:hypothetical protein
MEPSKNQMNGFGTICKLTFGGLEIFLVNLEFLFVTPKSSLYGN